MLNISAVSLSQKSNSARFGGKMTAAINTLSGKQDVIAKAMEYKEKGCLSSAVKLLKSVVNRGADEFSAKKGPTLLHTAGTRLFDLLETKGEQAKALKTLNMVRRKLTNLPYDGIDLAMSAEKVLVEKTPNSFGFLSKIC